MENQKLYFEIFGNRVEFGWNSLEKLGEYAKAFKSKKVLIVTDSGLADLGIPDKVRDTLGSVGIDSVIFQGVSPNPTDSNVLKGVRSFREEDCDTIIGVGGGSPMDAAKGIRVLVAHSEPLHHYYGVQGSEKIVNAMPPLIEIPTTSGTGSETSGGAVITDTNRNVKCVLRSGVSSLALVDPALTVKMPPYLTATTGLDALSHNIEAFLSPRYHPTAEALAYGGIRLTSQNLSTAVQDGNNRQARTQMAMASTIGALAFQKGLGVTHSLSHQLSSEFDVHHGLANAILLPHTMTFNLPIAKEKMNRIAFALGAVPPTPEAAIDEVARLIRKLGLPTRLSEVNVKETGIPRMAENAMADWCHSNNPRPCTEADMQMLYQNAL